MWRKYTQLLLLICLSTAMGRAHTDPFGEVYPRVRRIEQTFHVFFGDNSLQKNASDPWITYRRIYDKAGILIGNKAALAPNTEPPSGDVPPFDLPIQLRGISKKFRESYYTFPQYDSEHHGRPFYFIVGSSRHIRRNLEWGDINIDVVHDSVVTDKEILVLATRQRGKILADGRRPNPDLWLFQFHKNTKELQSKILLGTPAFIYNFPRASNLVLENGSLHFIWNEQTGSGSQRLHLVTYDLLSKSITDRPLPFASTWNTTISIGIIEDVLCLAYHGVGQKISTEFIKIRDL